MELSVVPKAVSPRPVAASHEGRRRNDDEQKMSRQGAASTRQVPPAGHSSHTDRPRDRQTNETGMAGMSRFAHRLRTDRQAARERERSLPHLQEARARHMRDKLNKTYATYAQSTTESDQPVRKTPRDTARMVDQPVLPGDTDRQAAHRSYT